MSRSKGNFMHTVIQVFKHLPEIELKPVLFQGQFSPVLIYKKQLYKTFPG